MKHTLRLGPGRWERVLASSAWLAGFGEVSKCAFKGNQEFCEDMVVGLFMVQLEATISDQRVRSQRKDEH